MDPAKSLTHYYAADLRPSRIDSLVWLSGACVCLFLSIALIASSFITKQSIEGQIGSDIGSLLLFAWAMYLGIPHIRFLFGSPAYHLSEDGITDWRRMPWQKKIFVPWEQVADLQVRPDIAQSGILFLSFLNGTPRMTRPENAFLVLNRPINGKTMYLIDHVRLSSDPQHTCDLIKEFMRRTGIKKWPETEASAIEGVLVDGVAFLALGIFSTACGILPFILGKRIEMPLLLVLMTLGGIWLMLGGIIKIRRPRGVKALDKELGFKN
jgi:hypothetical protein